MIPALAHALAVQRDILIITQDTLESRLILTLAYALLPDAARFDIRICTVCGNAETEGREEVVFLNHAALGSDPGALGKIAGLFRKKKERLEIDLGKGEIPSARGGRYGAELFALAQAELLEAIPWPETSFPETHQWILQSLDALMTGEEKRMMKHAEALPTPVGSRLKEFLKHATGRGF